MSWGVYLLILVWLTRSALDLVIWTGCACVFDGAGGRGISRSAYRVGDECVGCVLGWSEVCAPLLRLVLIASSMLLIPVPAAVFFGCDNRLLS